MTDFTDATTTLNSVAPIITQPAVTYFLQHRNWQKPNFLVWKKQLHLSSPVETTFVTKSFFFAFRLPFFAKTHVPQNHLLVLK
jgi:hypothetical protein